MGGCKFSTFSLIPLFSISQTFLRKLRKERGKTAISANHYALLNSDKKKYKKAPSKINFTESLIIHSFT